MTYPNPFNIPEEEILVAEANLVAKGLCQWTEDGAFCITLKGLDVMEALLDQEDMIGG